MTGGDLVPRILVALPLAALAVGLVAVGGWFFAFGVAVAGCICIHEFCDLVTTRRPVRLAAMLSMVGIAVAAQVGGPPAVLFATWVALPLTFLLIALRPSLQGSTDSILTTVFAVGWIALALGQAILLRNLAHGGAIVLDALLATFAMDSGAYLGGRAFGRTPLAVRISPKKTWEGLFAGAGTAVVAMLVASLYQEWLGVGVAVLIALVASVLGPLGDLFESLLKREAGAKDTSAALGPHGGLLDRIDGVLFSVVGIYWLWLLIL